MRRVDPGDSVLGKRLFFEGRKAELSKIIIQKSSSHRGQRAKLYDGECWIEVPIDLPKKEKKKKEKK